MVTIGAHLTMKPNLTVLKLNIFQKKLKKSLKQKYYDKYLENTSIQFDNVWILLC